MEFNSFSMVLLQLSVMLFAAIVFGQVSRKLNQPAVVGEIAAGLLVGVTVFGALAPSAFEWLFNSSAEATVSRDSIVHLGMLFFLFVAGSEVELSDLRRLGPKALSIGLAGTLVPLFAGVGLVYATVPLFWKSTRSADLFPLALFIGLSMANSANPVLARILMDLGLLKSEVGSVAMTATVVDDLVNWTVFALLLSSVGSGTNSASAPSVAVSAGSIVLLFLVVVGGGRWLGSRALHAVRRRIAWPTGFIGVVAVAVLVASTAAEAVGISAFLGAFLVGVALAGHDVEHREAHEVTSRFALGFFAPIYFVSMALGTDFLGNFDLALVLMLTVVASITKLAGVLLGAWIARMPRDQTTWSIAWGLNARGATGIVLASIGHAAGIVDDRVFVALVLMSLITTVCAGPMMKWSMRQPDHARRGKPRSIDVPPMRPHRTHRTQNGAGGRPTRA